ncbi:MAG: DinB family protein [Gemmatimonadaceae bacterium]|nr:DinB family protein [Gemmatimonadaceae bacterium]
MTLRRSLALAFAAVALTSAAAGAQNTTLIPDLLRDLAEVEEKLTGLAKAIPADKYGWRPSAGTRSVGEVVMHVASDNYFIPAAGAGMPAPAATGIKVDDYKTVSAYESRKVTPAQALKEMEASFAFLKKAMQGASPASLNTKQKVFGMEMTGQQLWILTATHLHEHLGQLIAYARSNNVVPPWSK